MDDQNGKKPLAAISAVVALFAALGVIIYTQAPLKDIRPDIPETRELSKQIRARLWQDPFQAVLDHVYVKDKKESVPPRLCDGLCDGICYLSDPQKSKNDTLTQEINKHLDAGRRVTVLGVMVFGGPYVELVEWRVRQRNAVLSGLNVRGFIPEDADHIRFLKTDDAQISLSNILPFEWLVLNSRQEYVLLLWINDDAFQGNPLAKLAALIAFLQPPNNRDKLKFKIIGPAGSTNLWSMMMRPKKESALPEDLEIYSATATVDDSIFLRESISKDKHTVKDIIEDKWKIKFNRTICTDRNLAKKLVKELGLRGVGIHDPIVLIAEWDTFYGRSLPRTFLNVLQEELNKEKGLKKGDQGYLANVEELTWVHRFSYLRGIDGKLPGAANEAQERPKNGADRKKQDIKSMEEAMGKSQYDYLRRLTDRISQLDQQQPIKAFGVLGSDFYDKYLVLQALGQRFPEKIFFTTDLDARLLHPANIQWTRNLVVASAFGLQLPEGLQRHIPPFRDSYQASVFFTILRAFDHPLAQDQNPPDPRIFEIGRGRAVDLAHDRPRLISWKLLLVIILVILLPAFLWFGSTTMRNLLHSLGQRLAGKPVIILAALVGLGLIIWGFDWILQNPLEEPFSWTEGVSVWPTAILRLVALGLSWAFFLISRASLRDNCDKLRIDFGLKKCADYVAEPDPDDAGKGFWNELKKFYEKNRYDWSRKDDEGPVNVSQAWEEYLRRGAWSYRVRRIFPMLLIYLFICFCIINFFGFPPAPVRGLISRRVDMIILIVTVVSFLFLTFFIFDATSLCRHFVTLFRKKKPQWDSGSVEKFTQKWTEDPKLGGKGLATDELSYLMLMQLIARRTDTVGKLIFYPFIVWFIICLSRIHYFDNWRTSIGLAIVIFLGALLAWSCAFMLRRSAENLRAVIIDRISEKLMGAYAAATLNKDNIERLKYVRDAVVGERTGAFASYFQNPVVQSLLVPFGGIGGLKLLDFLGI